MDVFKELSIFNRITFVEDTHTYLIDGQQTNSLSVTKTLKHFKRPFDVESAAKRVANKRKVAVDQIKAEWEANNLYSTTIGSMLHKYIENYYANKKIAYEGNLQKLGFDHKKKIEENFPKLVKHFLSFYENNKHLHCVRSEFVVGDLEDTKICGTSDMLCYNEHTNELEILDFKTNKKMEKYSKYGKLFYPFEFMTEGELNEYTIQLNTYKYFIEKYTKLKISKLKIIWFNVENDSYKEYELEDITNQIKLMLDCIKSNFLFAKI
jgi:ATP-dependent exoDNAse (exonuclease V) beta subunit